MPASVATMQKGAAPPLAVVVVSAVESIQIVLSHRKCNLVMLISLTRSIAVATPTSCTCGCGLVYAHMIC